MKGCESVVALLVKSIETVQDGVPAVKEPPLKVNDWFPGETAVFVAPLPVKMAPPQVVVTTFDGLATNTGY